MLLVLELASKHFANTSNIYWWLLQLQCRISLLLSTTCKLLQYCLCCAALFKSTSVLLQLLRERRWHSFLERKQSKLVLKVEPCLKSSIPDCYRHHLLGPPSAPSFISTFFLKKDSLLQEFQIFDHFQPGFPKAISYFSKSYQQTLNIHSTEHDMHLIHYLQLYLSAQ